MSYPVSAGDIIKALEIAHWIHKNCFNAINNASLLYASFRDDVLQLEIRIKQLQSSFKKAFEQVGRTDLTRLDQLHLEAHEVVGDYTRTLEECRKLLKRHAKFNGERATALDNAFWYTRTQPQVEKLRRELQSHSDKIYLFLEPVRLELVANISADAQEILALLRRQLSPGRALPEIPTSINTALTDALYRDPPVPFEGPQDIPLRESIDAVFRHHGECTVGSTSSGTARDIKQIISLLKADWLCRTIESSTSLRQSRQGSLYRRILEQLGQRIDGSYELLEIERWDEKDFEGLNESAWAIWPIKEPLKLELLTDKNDREEKLAEVPLVCQYADQKEDLHVFRVSEATLRIVRSRHLGSQSIGPQMTERFLDLDCDGLVPFYAVSSSSTTSSYTLNLTNGKGGGSSSYDFPSRKSALRIQSAFTGYDVVSLTTGIACTVTWRRALRINRSDQEKGVGEVQIWRWPVSKSVTAATPTETVSSRRSNSVYSGSGQSSIAQQTFQAFDPNIVSIADAQGGGEMMIAELPPPPALVFLVQRDSRYTMWYLDLSQLELKKTNARYTKTFSSILESSTGKSFPLRRLAVSESQLGFWNIRAIVVPTGIASKDKSKPSVEDLNGTSVVLDFASEKEQREFEAYLKHTAVQRMKQIQQYNLGRHVALSQSHTPMRRPSASSPTAYSERNNSINT